MLAREQQSATIEEGRTLDARPFPRLARELDAILDTCIPRGLPVALLQFPYDGNVGNHLMWIAITDYLRERGIRVGYAAYWKNYRAADMARAIGRGAVLFSGGVTISRLWPGHAQIKREVAADFPDNPLITLPSTVLFADRDDLDQARDIFGGHRNATVLTRDPRSGEQAREAFPASVRVITSPDLAFRLPAQPIRDRPSYDIIWLARDDVEGALDQPPSGVHVFDWSNDLRTYMPRAYVMLRTTGVISRIRSTRIGPLLGPALNLPMAELYRRASHRILDYGNRILDTGRVLVTDRMHPHILAALRGQHAVLLPDKFGKNRAVHEFCTAACPYVHWADTTGEALALAQSLV